MNLQDINIYVQNLGSLALGCIVLRVMWVFDVVFSVERAIKKSQPDGGSSSIGGDNDTSGDTGSGGDSTGGTGSEDSNTKPIDPNAIVSFTIQVSLFIILHIFT